MDELWQAAVAWMAALLTIVMRVAWPALTAWADERQQRAWLLVQERLGGAAARIAAEIAAEAAGSEQMREVGRAAIQIAGAQLGTRFRDLVRERGIPPATLEGLVRGELGKLGVAVR